MTKLLKTAVFFCLVLFSLNLRAADYPAAPQPFRYVNDYTKTLSPQEWQYLENKLQQYSQQTSSQIAVVLIPTTGDEDIAQYTAQLGDKWGIGRAKLNNGVLFLVAKNDRKVFIATGQGLQGVLPDAYLAQLIRQGILPYFKQGQYAQGINVGLDNIIAASQGEYAPQAEQPSIDDYMPLIMVIIFILFVLLSEFRERRKPYLSPASQRNVQDAAILGAAMFDHHRRSNNSFSGFGGSSGGGFGGGGFDGGGAGGSW